MNRNRKLLVLCLGLVLTAGLSCTAGDLPLATQVDGDEPAAVGPLPPGDSAGSPADSTLPDGGDAPTPVDSMGPVPVDSGGQPPVPGGDEPLYPTLLTCKPQPYAKTTAIIGPAGGQILVGNHVLKILENALREDVTITAEQVEGTANSVRFSPEGLRFAVPAILTLSYKNCDHGKHYNRIVYTDENLKILEPTLSLDFSSSSQVKGLIFHFSRYAVAY